MTAEGRRRDRKHWGAGCLALGLVAGLVAVGLGGLYVFEARRDVRPTPVDLTQALPLYEPAEQATDVAEAGRLILELEGVDLSIEPGPAGSPIQVQGQVDADGFELRPEYSAAGEHGWTYRLRVRPGRLMGRLVRRGGQDSSIQITLPAATPMYLEGIVDGGETRIELGGLWIVETDLNFSSGQQRIAFSQPLLWPMERLDIDAPIGELTMVEIGNASPRNVQINKNVGEACLDLGGAWQVDARLEIACGVGSCDVHRPGEDDAVVLTSGGEANFAESDLPVIEVVKTGVLSDNVEISQRLPKPSNSP